MRYNSGAMHLSVEAGTAQFDCGIVSVFGSLRPSQIDADPYAVRTGQPHRTLLGHTAPVTCLQFDETHVVTGSLDKSLRVTTILPSSDHPVNYSTN